MVVSKNSCFSLFFSCKVCTAFKISREGSGFDIQKVSLADEKNIRLFLYNSIFFCQNRGKTKLKNGRKPLDSPQVVLRVKKTYLAPLAKRACARLQQKTKDKEKNKVSPKRGAKKKEKRAPAVSVEAAETPSPFFVLKRDRAHWFFSPLRKRR